jgi:CheY-like chemotaxis protein
MINDPAKLNRLVKGVPTLRKLLVIDDNSLVRFALCLLLRRAGYEVLEASDGGEGQQVQSENDLDLLITDILMDGVDGLETIRKIREVSPDIKIIAISGGGHLDAGDMLQLAERAGADAIFTKPFDNNELLSKIAVLLGTPPPPSA